MGKIADYNPTEQIEIKRHELQLREYAAVVKLGRTTADSLRYERSSDVITKDLIERMTMSVLSDKIADDSYEARYRYAVYASWWEHFKHDRMPTWFKKRFPVVVRQKSGYVTVKFTRYAEYPKANVALQSNRHVYINTLGGFERITDEVSQTQ